MIKIVPEQGRAAQGKPATENTNPALAILFINTTAPARATPGAPAPPAVANIQNVIVNHLILGHRVLVNAHQLINTPARAQAIPAAPVRLAAANILNAIAQTIILGMVAVALFLAIPAINTPARVPVMQEVPAPPAVENIPPALVAQAMNGKTVAVNHY